MAYAYNGYCDKAKNPSYRNDSGDIGTHCNGTSVLPCVCGLPENWQSVLGHEHTYQISDHGRVRRLLKPHLQNGSKWRVLKTSTAPRGYCVVTIAGRTRNVHVVVLEAFVCPRPPGKWACHNDGDKSNNSLSNLRWDTPTGNFRDRDSHGNTSRGSHRPTAKLTESDVIRIRSLYAGSRRIKLIAKHFSVHPTTISRILQGKAWKHVPGPNYG